ncbi:MAG: hypothetical protein WCC63_06895 [Candidatus Bathyarchaeia archaeon]
MSEGALQQLEKLGQNLKSLEEERSSFTKEAEQWAERRDQIHKQIKDLRLEAASFRERRDTINAKVRMLKTRRNQTRASLKEKSEEAKQLKGKIQLLNSKKPKQAADAIRKEKEKIEWDIQTTSLTLQEEKPLVRRAASLELQLGIYRQMEDTRMKIAELRRETEEIHDDASLSHRQLSELAPQSQELHEKMVGTMEKAKKLQNEADDYHRNFLQSKQKAQNIHSDCLQVEEIIRALKQELAKNREQERISRENEARRRLKAEVLKKLEEGKKLTFEEFKLISEDAA